MEELTFKQLCLLFCCPPCPSRITSKMAFLPPKPTYILKEVKQEESASDSTNNKTPEKKYEFSFVPECIESGLTIDERFMKDNFEAFYTKSKRGHKIACLHIRSPSKTEVKYTILFSHGNAADLGKKMTERKVVSSV